MTPARLDLHISKGITFGPVLVTCKDASGNPRNLTGWSVFADARQSLTGGVAFSLAPQIVGGAGGQVSMSFTPEQTAALRAGTYRWDLVLRNPGGDRLGPYLAGKVAVDQLNTQLG